jgi:hypothetical protein
MLRQARKYIQYLRLALYGDPIVIFLLLLMFSTSLRANSEANPDNEKSRPLSRRPLW